jgi:DNA-binding XRE family transcriptional regulator
MAQRITMAAARVNAGLTQEELAAQLGVTRQTYASWEAGKAEMKTAYFIAFCQIVGFNSDDIVLPFEFTESKSE